MAPEEIAEYLKKKFGDKITDTQFDTAHPRVTVDAAALQEIALFLRDDSRTQLNFLTSIAGVDLLEDDQLCAAYELISMRPPARDGDGWTQAHAFCVQVKVPRNDPKIPTVAHIWRAADWHERETYDLMGIVFEGHPDSVNGPTGKHPRRILCPDDWAGHPLRKDYMFPMEYHGIPAVTELGQTRPVH
jgi:NADH-quinone oxidoreductase subunit C